MTAAPELAAAAAGGDPDAAQLRGYLAQYGYSAADASSWEPLLEAIPTFGLSVAGHEERGGHTWYIFGCSVILPGVAATLSWERWQRLGALRERWHDPVRAALGPTYDFHFGGTPFASRGGLPGTTARLQGWCGTLVSCINRHAVPPSIVFLTLQFLEAPEPPTVKSAWGTACQANPTVSLADAPPDVVGESTEKQEQPLEQQQQQKPVASAWAANLTGQRDAATEVTKAEVTESAAALLQPQQERSEAHVDAVVAEQRPRDDTADTSPVRKIGGSTEDETRVSKDTDRIESSSLDPCTEFGDQPLVVMLHCAHNIPALDLLSESDVFVHGWLQGEDGSRGVKACWPVKWNSAQPLWESARRFGTSPPPAGTKLLLEFTDRDEGILEGGDDFIGTAEVQVDQLHRSTVKVPILLSKGSKVAMSKAALSTAEPPYAVVSRLNPSIFPSQKIVYIVRHGESVWNDAQAHLNGVKMMSDTDHPLNEVGKAQAEALQKSLVEGGPVVDELIRADAVICSPLTRAVETCLIGLKPMFDGSRGSHSVILNPNLREKRNFGGKDSSGKWQGEQIPEGVREALKALYSNSTADGIVPSSVESLLSVELKIDLVMNKWWHGSKESERDISERIVDMLCQLQFTPAWSIVLVGHSHYFRELLRHFRKDDCSYTLNDGTQGESSDLDSKILSNAGIAKLDVDFSGFGSESKAAISAVELLFATRLIH